MKLEVQTPPEKEAIELIPPPDRNTEFYSWYFIVSKKDDGLLPIRDLHQLNCSLRRFKFKMLTIPLIVSQIKSEDWFVTVNLKDAYFHFSFLPQHGKFLRFTFGGKAYQYRDPCTLLRNLWMQLWPLKDSRAF